MSYNGVTINTGSFSADLLPGVTQWVPLAIERYKGQYSKIFEVRKSSQNVEIYNHTVGMGLAAEKPEGGRIQGDSIAQTYRDEIRNVVYAKKWAITMEAQKDPQKLKLAQMATESAAEMMELTKEYLAFRLLNNAFSTSVVPAYGDGKAMCVSDHPNGIGGTFSNVLTAPGVVSEEVLETIDINVRQLADEAGIVGMFTPSKLILKVDDTHRINRILNSSGRVDTANNDLNSLRDKGVYKDVILTPYLTDNRTFFVLTNAKNGLIHLNNMNIEIDSWDDKETKSAMFSALMRIGFGCVEKRQVYGVNGT